MLDQRGEVLAAAKPESHKGELNLRPAPYRSAGIDCLHYRCRRRARRRPACV